MICPICRSSEQTLVRYLYDDRYGYDGVFPLFKCKACAHNYLMSDLSETQVIRLYTDFYPRKSFNISQYQPHKVENGILTWIRGKRSSAFRWVPEKVRILDIGCGFGESLGYHTARECDVYGVEADQNISRVVEKFGFKVHVGLFDADQYQSDFFDYITMDQVIEHVSDPLLTLLGIARILKPHGQVIISTPNARGWGEKVFRNRWMNWHAPYHLHFFSLKSMKIAAEQAGLELTMMKTITNSDWLLFQLVHWVTYPMPGKKSWFWSQGISTLSLKKKILVKFFTLLHKTGLNHLLTRIFDGLSIGDNWVFVLTKR